MKKIIVCLIALLSFTQFSGINADETKDLSSPKFEINVGEISPGWSGVIAAKSEVTIDNFLKRIIERLIIAIGTIALFVMTLWAGQIILYAGEDERLTRWKTMFNAWMIAVAAALLSWLMVQLVAYLLYI